MTSDKSGKKGGFFDQNLIVAALHAFGRLLACKVHVNIHLFKAPYLHFKCLQVTYPITGSLALRRNLFSKTRLHDDDCSLKRQKPGDFVEISDILVGELHCHSAHPDRLLGDAPPCTTAAPHAQFSSTVVGHFDRDGMLRNCWWELV